jgi:hypothetical protein
MRLLWILSDARGISWILNFKFIRITKGGQNSSVGTAMGYRLDGLG